MFETSTINLFYSDIFKFSLDFSAPLWYICSRFIVISLYFWSMSLIILVSHIPSVLNQITSRLYKKPSRSLKSEKLSLDTSLFRTCFLRHCTFIGSWNARKSIKDLISDLQFNRFPMAHWMLILILCGDEVVINTCVCLKGLM